MRYIPRMLSEKLKAGFRNNRIIVVIGSRQVGKTTLLKMYRKNIAGAFKQFYFHLEDISHLHICQSVDNLKSYLRDNGIYLEKQKVFLIIDEFQYVKNATKLFKVLYDLYPSVRILASGSSSIEIQKHLKESLAGRKKVYHLYPLTLEEFLRFQNGEAYQRYTRLNVGRISAALVEEYNKNFVEEYLVYGGYPKVALLKNKTDKIEELQDIYNSYIQKDIKSLIRGEEISAYNNLVAVLASQIGNLLNIHELSNTLRIGRRQVLRYLNVLEQTFIIKLLRPFCLNKRKEISKMPKLYLVDNGIANFSLGNFRSIQYRPDAGRYVENFVFSELVKYKPVHYRAGFWRTLLGTEVDFVLEGNDELIPIDVKWQEMAGPAIPKSFYSFLGTHKNVRRAIIVTKTFSGTVHREGRSVHFIPVLLFGKFMKTLS